MSWLTHIYARIKSRVPVFICARSNNEITGGVVGKQTQNEEQETHTYTPVFTMISPYKHINQPTNRRLSGFES